MLSMFQFILKVVESNSGLWAVHLQTHLGIIRLMNCACSEQVSIKRNPNATAYKAMPNNRVQKFGEGRHMAVMFRYMLLP